nr:uncharacterized protein LOC124809582 [Hydra vulgaris]
MLNCVANENKDRMKRDKNLIVFGIPASTKKEPNEKQVDDENKIKELLTNVKINSDNIIKCFRLRSKDPNKPPPIIVETTDTVARNNIVKAAWRKFEGIYVNPDLTEAQRRQDRQLRDELKKKNEPLNLKNNWAKTKRKSFSTISLLQQSAFHKIPCCYTNATSLNNKMPEFLASIETYNPKIIFVTETWWHESSITNIENYMLFRKDRVSSRGGGVAIYVDTSLKPNELSEIVLLDSPEQIWCEISYGSEHKANGYKNLKLVNEYKACNIQLKKLIYKARCEFELDLAIKSKHNPKILFNVFNKNEDDELPYFIKRTEAICKYSQITLDLVKNKLSNLSVVKTVGLDGVSAYVLKNCSDSFSIPLSAIFQKSLYSGCCPKVWKKANVTPLFKNGSGLDPGNYRPISLTSVVCKVMEKILRDTMVNHLVEHSLISKNQHGFVNKKACVTNLLESIDMMSKALSDKISMDVAFIDFSKAFDMVSHKRLIYKLEAYGFTGNLLNWIKSFLHQRFQRIVMGDYVSSWLEVFSGVPQGSVLGPKLFIIFVNDISDIVNYPCKMYADDTKLLARLDHPLASQTLQTDIYNIADWCNTWKMKLNLDKCKIMHIGKKKQLLCLLNAS